MSNEEGSAARLEAERLVTTLFECILERSAVGKEELQYWSTELLSGRSAAEVVRLFYESEEKKHLSEQQGKNRTRYPHGHFYSPVVDVEELRRRGLPFEARHSPSAININVAYQMSVLGKLSHQMAKLPFENEKVQGLRYHFNNTSYAFGDACVYWAMIADLRPSRIVEVGCGYTSALALDAIERFELNTHCTFIDPYPDLLLAIATPISSKHEVIPRIIQEVDLAVVDQLKRNDILFIDSSHVVKTSSDVHFELTTLLPRLAPGVVIHFHDVFYPFEYPSSWILEDNLSWNEVYYLHTFLQYNTDFEIIYFNDYVAKEQKTRLRAALPEAVASRIELNPGGGLWLRRC